MRDEMPDVDLETPQTNPSKKRKILLGCGGAILLLLAVAGVLFWKYSADSSSELQAEIRKTKAEGDWVEKVSDLVPPISGPNAADLYDRAFKAVDIDHLKNTLDLFDPAKKDEVGKYLAKLEPALVIVRHTLDYPNCRFPNVPEVEIGQTLPDAPDKTSPSGRFRTLVGSFVAKAHQEMDPAQAILDLRIAAKVSRDVGQQFGLISNIAHVGCDRVVLRGIERELTRFPNQAAKFNAVLDELGPVPDARRDAQIEMILAREALVKSFSKNEKDSLDSFKSMWFGPFENKTVSGYIHFGRLFMEKSHAGDRLSTLKSVARQVQDQADASYWFAFLFDPFHPYFEAVGFDVALRRMAGEAIEKVVHNDFSPSLPIQGEPGEDPYDDKPLSIKKIPGGFRLFAVGQSGRLLGGVRDPQDLKNSNTTFDYPFVESLPSKRSKS